MIPLPISFKLTDKKDNYARLEIEGLYPGYGTTFGNSLRRILLSSLEGAAVVRVKIKGVQHEYSTIPGVLEDVISIILNLKKLRFKFYGDEPQKGIIRAKGEKVVKGRDIELPSQVEVVNKDQVIATLTGKKSELEMEITINKGVGYEPVELRKESKLEIGEIPVDAIYTPIRKVNFKTENMRVGKRIDFDKLILEIETDGTITPEEAFSDALNILRKHVDFFQSSLSPNKTKKVVNEKEENSSSQENKTKKSAKTQNKENNKVLLEELGLSPKLVKILTNSKIKTLAGLLKKSEDDIKDMKGIGDKGIKEIKKVLKKRGLELKS